MSWTINNYSITGANPSTVGGTGTGTKFFPNLPGPSIGVANTTPSSTSGVGQLDVPGSNRLNGIVFHALASGNFEVGAGGACPSVTITVSANTGTKQSPSYTVLATTGAITAQNLDGVFYPWYVDDTLEGDTLSGVVQGSFSSQTDGVAVSGTTLTHNLSGINFSTQEPAFGLVVGVQFSVSEPGNSANMYQFQIQS